MKTLDAKLENADFQEAIYTDSTPDCRTYLQYEGDKVISNTVQDTSQIQATNKVLRDNDAWNQQKDFKLYARIPEALWLHWQALGITQDPKALLNAIEIFKDEVKVTNRRF